MTNRTLFTIVIRENGITKKETDGMPIYEYHCSACDHQFELRQKFSDPPASVCPKCGGNVAKMISNTAFSLKGDGWFKTGYCPKTEAPKPAACAGGGCCAG